MKNLIKRFTAVFLSILVVLSSFSLPTITSVFADEIPTEAVTEYVEEATEPAAPEVAEVPTEPAAEVPQEIFDAPAETEEAAIETEAASEEATEEETAEEETEETTEEEVTLNKEILPFHGATRDIEVHVTADPGTFPEGTTMAVVPVSASAVYDTVNNAVEGEVSAVIAVDITFYDKNGKEVQPQIPVHMTMTAPGMDQNAPKDVVHIDDQNKADVISNATISGDQAVLDAKSFSIYAIVETGNDARLLVKFCKPDGSEIKSMYVKQNDDMNVVLYDPGVGNLEEGVYFRGWTTDPDYTSETAALSIEDVRSAVQGMLPPAEDGTTVIYYAMLFKDYRITYLDENDISLGQEEVTFRADATDSEQSYTVNMGYTVPDDTHHFEGWKVREGSSYIKNHTEGSIYQNNDVITVTGDVTFGVNAPEGHWFIFDENGKGATYNAPQFIYSSDTPTKPEDENMLRNGYTFGGWFEDKETADQTSGGTLYDFGQTLSDKTTVYARWIPKTRADYTIIIWKQNVEGNGYDFEEAIRLSGNVGSTINTVTSQGTGNNRYARINGDTKQYTGFHLKEFDQNVTINTEGSSVLNVYYDRNEHTLQFQVTGYIYTPTTSNTGTQYGYYNNNYVQLYYNNGTWYRTRTGNAWTGYNYSNPYSGTRYIRSGGNNTWTTIKTITALYGQSIGDNFPIEGTNGVTYNNGERWQPQNSSTYSEVLVFIDTMPNENVTFHLNTSNNDTKTIYYYTEALPGVTPEVTYNGKGFVEYKSIDARYGFFTEAEDYINLEGFIKGGNAYPPLAYNASGTPLNTVWNNGDARYVFCFYTRNAYPIHFMDGKYVDGDNNPLAEASMGQISTETGIAYGADVSSFNNYKPDDTPKGYVFEGWYIDSACTQPYTFDKMPEGGITVFAKWRQKQYRVFLHVNYPEGATGNINWGTQNQQLNFRISEGGHVSEPTGRDLAGFEFVGWYLDEACTQVFNGEAYEINEDNVTTPYDKTVDMTDTYDNNGNLIDPKFNSDANGYNGGDRFWITEKLDVYAKWRSTIEGASGIVIEYNANGGTGAPSDSLTYVDGAKASAGFASKAPSGSNKVFGYWEVQKWQDGSYVSSGVKVLPGKTFTVNAADAKVEDIENPAADGDTKKYTVQLKAVYIDSEAPTPSHISWFKNDGSEAYHKDPNAEINVGVNIPEAPTRDGYEFLGWARVATGNTSEAANAWEATSSNWTQNLTASDIYLYYAEDGTYHLDSTSGTAVTQVAPDENTPYHAMFAVWEEKDVTITYAVAADSTGMGTVDPESEPIKAVSGTAAGSTATAASTTYVFDYWTVDDGTESISTDAHFTPSKNASGVYEEHTYYAHFKLNKADVTVHHYLKGTETKVAEDVIESVTIGTEYTATPATTYQEKDLTVFSYNPSQTVTVSEDGNVITIYYTLPLTITAKTDRKVYDAQPLTGEFTVTGALPTDNAVIAAALGTAPSIIYVMDSPKDYQAGTDGIPGYYDITNTSGTLTIEKRPLTITASNESKVYDGERLYAPAGREFKTGEGELVNGDEVWTYIDNSYGPDVGSGEHTIRGALITNRRTETIVDVTNCYDISYVFGTYTITPKAVTITVADACKVYGETDPTFTGTVDGLVNEGDLGTITYSRTNNDENVGKYTDVLDASYTANNNYTVTVVKGDFEITKKAVTITADSGTKVYDGTPLTKNSYTNTPLAEGDSIDSVTVTGSQTVVGSSNNVPSAAKIVNADGKDVTTNYEITYANGTLEVTKKALTITADSDTKVYDGTALTKDSYTNTALAEGDSIESVTVTGSQTDVGSSNNVPSGAVIKNAAGEDVTTNYEITYANGTLEVTKKALTITADSDTKVYDGTALTKNSYTNTDLAEGDSIESVTVTGSQTVVGSSSNVPSAAVIKNAKGNDVTDNYDITYANGTLLVTVNESLIITADSDTKVYDGTALTKNSYQVAGLANGDSVESVTVTGSQTTAGTSNNVPSAAVIKNAAGEDVTSSYLITYKKGTLEVTQKPITITADSDTKVYDGTALTKDSYTNSDLAAGDSIESVTVTGSQTVVGSSNNVPSAAVIKNAAGEDVTSSYEITYANGTLEVTKKAVTITADSDTKVYDGTALIKGTYTNTDLAAGDSFESVTVTGSQTVVGTSDNVPSAAVIKNAAGEDVTTSYEITYANGTLEVTKKAVTVTADSDEKVYDGTALTKDSYTNTALATGDTIESVTVTGSQIVVGTSDNVPSGAVIKNAAGEDVTASYDITYVNGTLEVTKKAVTITADSGTKVYDGTALTKNSYTNTALASGDSIDSVTVTGSQTVVGSSNNVPSAAIIKNADGEDVTASYEITYANGTLEVTKKALTITADSDTKVYDGTPLTKNSYTNTALASGDSIDSVTVTGSQIVVGSSANIPSAAKIVNADGEDVTDSYDITYANGTLEVTKKALTITADSDTKVYDGTPLTKNSYTNTALAEGDSIESVTVTGSQTVVGSSDNVPSAAVIKNAAGVDVTASYEITYANGTLEVTVNQALIITADSDTKVYDGTALTKNSYQVAGLAEGDRVESVTVTGSQTVAGTSDNVPSAAKIVNADGEDVTASYKITYANGTLDVTKKAVTITAGSDTKVYDGTALTKDSYTNTELAAGDSFDSVTVTGSQTVVGTCDNVPSAAVIKNAAGEDVTTCYEITYANGTLEVTKKALTITADSDTKVYDGTPLTKNGYTNTALASGDSIDSVTVTGSQTVVGSIDNVPSAAKIVNADGEDVTSSYEITYTNGTLEVTKKAITITADSDSKVYDGTPLTKDTYTKDSLAAGDTVDSITITGSQTVVGTSNNVPSAAIIKNADGIDVTASYEITYANGTLEVTKKAVTITADSDTKVYDGTALTKNSYTNTALATGDSIDSVTVTGSQIVVGSSDNVPSAAKIVNTAGEDVTSSYEITYANGTLEVTQKAVTITADSDTKVYDGTPLTKNSYTNTALAEGDSIESVTVTGSQTVVGSSDNVPSAAKIVNAAGEDVTKSYKITYANGTLQVTVNSSLIITADSDTKVYDGTALTKNSYQVAGLAEGDSVESVTVTGSQTTAGTSNNVPSAAVIKNADGEDVTSSYEITYNNGTLEVTQKALMITADSNTKVYDGTPLTKNSYTNTALADGDSITSVTVTGSQTTAGTSNNVPSEAVIKNAAGEDVTASYNITYANGTLEVTKKTLTITADSGSKVYDGTDLIKNSYTKTEIASGDRVDYVAVTGSQKSVGTSNNVPSGAVIKNAADEDVTSSYEIVYVNGTLEVTKRSVTLKSATKSKVYDGKELTDEDVSISGDGFVEGEVTDIKATGKVKDVADGSVKNAITYKTGKDFDENNYTISLDEGTLSITPAPVSVTAKDVEINDGDEEPKLEVEITGLVDGESEELIEYEIIREDGSAPGNYKIIVTGETEQGNYTVTFFDGVFAIDAIITYDFNGGNIDGDEGPRVIKGVKVGQTITIIEAPVREGYEFDYWEGSKHYPGDTYTVTDSHKFTAVWKEIKPADDETPSKGSDIKTGDNNNIVPLVITMSAAALVILVLLIIFIRRKREEESES